MIAEASPSIKRIVYLSGHQKTSLWLGSILVQISGQPTKPFEAGAASLLAKRLLFETF